MWQAAWTHALWQAGTEFLYPPTCLWCEKLLPSGRGNSLRVNAHDVHVVSRFCQDCEAALARTIPHRCRRCSAPVGPNLNTTSGCIHCNSDPMHAQTITSLGPYADDLKMACLRCKKPTQAALTDGLTELLCHRHADPLRSLKPDLVLPVPHFWVSRLFSDHAANVVAERLGRFLNVPVERHLLRKVKWTRRQVRLSPTQRRNNLRGCFRVSQPESLKGRKILLADDILTTGTTTERCTQVLLKSGVERVDIVVLARAIGA